MKISLIIPFYNRWEITHRCLFNLYQQLPPTMIVLVNDGSTDVSPKALHFWRAEMGKHEIIFHWNSENLGFSKSMNIGAEIAIKNGAEILVFYSNDVTIKSNFLPEIQEIISNNKRTLIGNRKLVHDTGWNTFQKDGKKRIFPYLEGHLLACHVDTWRDLGRFDEQYSPFDYEDVDLSTMAIYKGYKLIPLNNFEITHLSGGTIYPEHGAVTRANQTNKNKKKFFSKWSRLLNDKW